MDVPKQFLSQHKRSLRHKTNVKIADIAIHRMKKHINNTDSESDDDIIDESAHFCSTCVSIIDSKEKDIHDKSLVHRNASIVEKLFNDFLILYNCNENINTNEKEQTKSDVTQFSEHNIKKTQHPSKTTAVNNQIAVTNNDSNKSKKAIEKEQTIKDKPIGIEENQTVDKEELSMTEFISLLNERCNQHKMFLKALKGNFIEIETVDGSVVKVTDVHFHGFNRIGKKHIQCLICNNVFKEKAVEKHVMSEAHMAKLIIPIKDKDCARQIENSMSHCLICNVITENSDLHSFCNKSHNNHLKDALISEKLYEIVPSTSKNTNMALHSQETNNEIISTSGRSTDENVGTETKERDDVTPDGFIKLAKKYFCAQCNEHISVFRRSKHNTTSKHILNLKSDCHYLMKEVDDTRAMCRICDTPVPNNIEDIRKHALDDEHIQKYQNLLKYNCILRIDNRNLYCELCKETFMIKNEIIHLANKLHQVKSFNVAYANELADHTEQSDVESEKAVTDFYYCDVCNVKVPNYGHNIEEHNNGKSHTKNVENRSDKTKDNINIVRDDITNDVRDNDTNDVAIHYQMEQTIYPNVLKCIVCEENILTVYVSQHLINQKHEENYEKLLKNHMLTVKSNDIYCEICSVSVGQKSEIMHIQGRKHNKNIEKRKILNTTISSTDSGIASDIHKNVTNVSGMITSEPSTSTIDVEAMALELKIKPEMVVFLEATDKISEVMCKICNVRIPFHEYNIRTHINGAKHIQVHKTLIGQEGKT